VDRGDADTLRTKKPASKRRLSMQALSGAGGMTYVEMPRTVKSSELLQRNRKLLGKLTG
jgi:hypothetical protein